MLYPAYASYKAIKTKDAKEYVQWMMYWIVFAVYSVVEIFSDTFIGCWFPFYYELKILFMFWMLSPTTRGGSTLYRTFIHPTLNKHEKEIDGYLADAKIRTGNMVTSWGSRALSYVSDSFVRIVLRSERPSSLELNNNGACANTLAQGTDQADNECFVHNASETLLVHTPAEHQAPHMSMDYFLENNPPQQRSPRMPGPHDYGRIPNQGNGYDQADDGRRYSTATDMDDYDNFSDAGVPLNFRGPMDKDPLYIPPGAIRKEAQMSKKMRNEGINNAVVRKSRRTKPTTTKQQ